MSARQRQRSEETKQAILAAATELFSRQGYGSVSMREIAKRAGCSHTTIYIYFKDKEELLYELARPALDQLKGRLESAANREPLSAAERLEEMGMEFVRYGLANRSMYALMMMTEGENVELSEPRLAVNRLRNDLFRLLVGQMELAMGSEDRHEVHVECSRAMFYLLNGIVSTYIDSHESYDALTARLEPTFRTSIRALMRGLHGTMQERSEWR